MEGQGRRRGGEAGLVAALGEDRAGLHYWLIFRCEYLILSKYQPLRAQEAEDKR